MRKLTILLCLLCAGIAQADPATTEAPAVEVKGIRNPLLKPYKYMVAGLDTFDDKRALAPQATTLRFKLRPRTPNDPAPMQDLKLRLAGDQHSIDLPIDSADSFELPRSQAALDDNADLELNKPKTGYRWQPDIHSAGVPAGMRRMGDLRLECEVLVSIAKKEIGFLRTAFINSLLLSGDWCNHKSLDMPTVVTRKLVAATLVEGEKRTELKVVDDGMGYMPPLRDGAVSDDALIELRHVE
jgi:hypothetical protein